MMVEEVRLGNWLQRFWNRKEIALLKMNILLIEKTIDRESRYASEVFRILNSAKKLSKDIENQINHLERFPGNIREIIGLERSLVELNESIVENEKLASGARKRVMEGISSSDELRKDVRTLKKYS